MQKKCKIAVAGFGQRGYAYVNMVKDRPDAELVAVCDADYKRAQTFARETGTESVPCYRTVEEMVAKSDCDAVIITTPDFAHRDCAIACCNAGKSIMLEKPMAPTAAECRDIITSCIKNDCILQVGFVLRNHPVFSRVIEIVRAGKLGQLLNITAAEHISVMHGASYMRRWHRKVANSGGFMLAKCSHDIDLISAIADSRVVRVASFGSLNFFTSDKLRHEYCSECPDKDCRFRFAGEFVRMTPEEKEEHSGNRFDLCVYNKDKDVVDHEVSIFDFANGVKANFTLNLFAAVPKRTICVAGSGGILYADTAEECIHIDYSDGRECERIECKRPNQSGHGGSDLVFLDEFIDCVVNHRKPKADCAAGLASTLVGNAVEKARLENRVVEIPVEAYDI